MRQKQQNLTPSLPATVPANLAMNGAIGMDLGDRWSRYCVINAAGEVVVEDKLRTTAEGLERRFREMPATRVVIEAAAHSPWVSRQLLSYGHEVIVANPRRVRAIYQSDRKNDRMDARMLARLGRMDASLLAPIHHRSAGAQADLSVVRGRDALVTARTRLVNAVRGIVKAAGHQLPKSGTSAFAEKALPLIPTELRAALLPLLRSIRGLTEQIRRYDARIEELAEKKYPQTRLLRQVSGVGPLISLTYVLTLEDPRRFPQSRTVGSYLGLCPRQHESGGSAPELGISKAGNGHLRWLLVQSAQYILGVHGPDSSLRRWGLELAARGGKKSKRRAVVGVARKLAVLLHRLWVSAEVYEPLRGVQKQAA